MNIDLLIPSFTRLARVSIRLTSIKPMPRRPLAVTLIAFLLVITGTTSTALGRRQDPNISVQLSSRQAFVGSPLTMQISIGSDQYTLPDLPKIDGCDFTSAGVPSVSRQTFSINGRVTKSVTTKVQFLITPNREGTFTVPELTFNVAGRDRTIESFEFTATKSETGDLMYAEIIGAEEQVYVGEPLDLTLRVWVKAYRDSKERVSLSIGDTFNLFDSKSSWGSFDPNKLPAGKRITSAETVRKNDAGEPTKYYLFEFPATVYAKRAGPIDTSDIRIRLNYPTSLQRVNDVFGRAFGRQLEIGSTRPIEAIAKSENMIAIDVPTEGRPDDYRGAVGNYRIVTKTEQESVDADDPIKLQIGIVGKGRMDLLQAPPLADLPEITKDFKVSAEAIPGFARQVEKVFQTSIRPRRANISEIPAIPFSFFNPETETFETVYSKPIPITVRESETLSLSEFGKPLRDATVDVVEPQESKSTPVFHFENDFSPSVLSTLAANETPVATLSDRWWWYSISLPPAACLLLFCAKMLPILFGRLPNLRSATSICRNSIAKATNDTELATAVRCFLESCFSQKFESNEAAVGSLRMAGLNLEANETEMLLDQIASGDRELDSSRQAVTDWLNHISNLLATDSAKRRNLLLHHAVSSRSKRTATLPTLVLAFLVFSPSSLFAQDSDSIGSLSQQQQETLLLEANELYRSATTLANDDVGGATDESDSQPNDSTFEVKPEARQQFQQAATKYQQLIDSGIRSEAIFMNAANAYSQAYDFPRAIVNYRRVLIRSPNDVNATNNCQLVERLLAQQYPSTAKRNQDDSFSSVFESVAHQTVAAIGSSRLRWSMAICSIAFWSMLAVAIFSSHRSVLLGMAVIPLLMFSLAFAALHFDQQNDMSIAIVTAKSLDLREGDDSNFPITESIDVAYGQTAEVLDSRANWLEIKMPSGSIGWTNSNQLERVELE